jgi:hypothetical protein
MPFKLKPVDVRLVIDPDAVAGGLDAWGDGDLEVVVDGSTNLEQFFDLIDRLSGLPSDPGRFDGSQVERMRSAFREFGATIREWSIEDIPAGAEGFARLPFPLAVAIFAAWQQAAQPSPRRPALSVNGDTSPVAFGRMAAS